MNNRITSYEETQEMVKYFETVRSNARTNEIKVLESLRELEGQDIPDWLQTKLEDAHKVEKEALIALSIAQAELEIFNEIFHMEEIIKDTSTN